MEKITSLISSSQLKFLENLKVTKLVYIKRAEGDILDDHYLNVEISVFEKCDEKYKKESFKTLIKKMSYGSLRVVKRLIFRTIKKKLLDKGDKVFCIVDENIGIGYKDVSFIFDIDNVLVNISKHKLSEKVPPSVIEAILDIATEISNEGREGKKIGTAFVVGDKRDLMKYVKQLVLNPFFGYSHRELKITDPTIRETVKEFAQLDGVYVINSDGSIVTSCAYLDVPTHDVDLQGFGTRHLNCAALTKQTEGIAVVVSSTGTIRVFKEGKIVMKI